MENYKPGMSYCAIQMALFSLRLIARSLEFECEIVVIVSYALL